MLICAGATTTFIASINLLLGPTIARYFAPSSAWVNAGVGTGVGPGLATVADGDALPHAIVSNPIAIAASRPFNAFRAIVAVNVWFSQFHSRSARKFGRDLAEYDWRSISQLVATSTR
jgi:hypothetical protein